MDEVEDVAIGIDLGTTNSCIAIMRGDEVKIIPNEQGKYVTPSYVSFDKDKRTVGYLAKNSTHLNPENTVFAAKRLIGRKWNDPIVQNDMKHWPFTVQNVDGEPHIQVEFKGKTKLFRPEEISSIVLDKMKEIAERYIDQNQKLVGAVITVPAYFNDAQRQATIDAGRIAGINVLKIINEPTAAAIAYAHRNYDFVKHGTNILVFDLGGGTFDVTILRVDKDCITVKATNGDTHLGGEDFDSNLVDYCVKHFQRKHTVNLKEDAKAMRRLRSACERAKRDLSSTDSTDINVDCVHNDLPMTLSMKMLRPRFEEINKDLLDLAMKPVQLALIDAKLSKSEINKIVLVGGSTRIPVLQQRLTDFFDGKKLDITIDADRAVAHGAAVQAAALIGESPNMILGRLLNDITPLSLGIQVETPPTMSVIIRRNRMIPAKETKENYTTKTKMQKFAMIRVYQGEGQNVDENFLLGEFRLSGFQNDQKVTPKIAVTFEIDANGIFTATARDQVTGSTNGIKIERVNGRLKKEQIEKMIEDAENYRKENDEQMKANRAAVALENECFSIKRKMETVHPDAPPSEQNKILKMCDEFLGWMEEDKASDIGVYEERKNELIKSAQGFFDKYGGKR